MTESVWLVLRVVVALAAVVALVWYLGRRLGARRAGADEREHSVRVLDRQVLGRHAGVAVLAVGERRLLLGFGEQHVTMLTELGPVAQVPAPARLVPLPEVRLDDRAASAHPLRATGTDGDVAVGPVAPAPAAQVAPAPTTATPLNPGPLQGSVLAPGTWKQAVRALQDMTVRR